MGFRWVISFGLLVFPIAVTLGVLLGVQSHREATGQSPLFVDNGITKAQYCQKAFGITPNSKGQQYTLNPNQWGWTEGEPGQLCMNVTSFNNNTYATKYTAPEFSVTWQYPQGPETAPVHAFPNIKVDSNVLPTTLRSLEAIDVDLKWTYGVGNKVSASTDDTELTENLVNTNVAIDMFLDSDRSKAQDSTKAAYEIMVWFAAFGAATQPIGLSEGVITTKVLNGITFSLYFGQNSLEQSVLTWVASETVDDFSGDLVPLVEQLTSLGRTDFPTTSDFIGYMGLGSEALSAKTNVTFSVLPLTIDIQASSNA